MSAREVEAAAEQVEEIAEAVESALTLLFLLTRGGKRTSERRRRPRNRLEKWLRIINFKKGHTDRQPN